MPGKSMSCPSKSAAQADLPVEITPDMSPDLARRSFLASAAALASIAVAPGVILTTVAKPAEAAGTAGASSKVRWGILVDVSKCDDGCTACISACSKENGWSIKDNPATDSQWIRKVELTDNRTGAKTSLPVMCQHCAEPPCVDVCPTGASHKRPDGIVLVDKHHCIGCRYCMMACPYGARSFIHEDLHDQRPHAPRGKGTVESCDMCASRVDAGKLPACVEACGSAGSGAFMFGDLNDPNSDIAKAVGRMVVTRIRADLGLDQGVLYTGL